MYTVKCPNCGCENKNTNIRCESCKAELIHIEKIERNFEHNSQIGKKQNDKSINEDSLQINEKQNNITISLGGKKAKLLTSIIALFFVTVPTIFISLVFGVGVVSIIVSSLFPSIDYNVIFVIILALASLISIIAIIVIVYKIIKSYNETNNIIEEDNHVTNT